MEGYTSVPAPIAETIAKKLNQNLLYHRIEHLNLGE
jgi:hypothetical protein